MQEKAVTACVGDQVHVTWVRRIRYRLRTTVLFLTGMTLLAVGGMLTLVVATVTLFRFRRFYAEAMIAPLAHLALWSVGIRFVVHQDRPLPQKQMIFIANHASTIDIFLLTAMRLPNARFFLSGFLRTKLPPIGLLGYLAGVFWTCSQSLPKRRVKIFERAERVLRRTGESVFLSPEGNIGRMGVIASFNKGAFHLATNLSAPIVPIYIAIPREMDPGWSYNFRPGIVHVYIRPPIQTKEWNLEDLDANRQRIHEHFLELQSRYQG